MSSSTVVIVVASGRKCGACGECGHDRRNCPTKPAAGGAGKSEKVINMADHYASMSHTFTGPVRPTDPTTYWSNLGSDAGTYPFQRDAKGCLHLPLTCVTGGNRSDHAELLKMKEYTWDAAAKVFRRTCACPGCM